MLNAWLAFRAFPWKTIGFAALGLALALMFAALKAERSHSAKLQAQIEKCAEARKADRSAYESAQSKAKADNLIQVRKIEEQQRGINDEVTRDLNARLERLRSELRQSAPKGAPGSAGPSQGGGGAGAPGEAGVCLAPEEFLRAAESEERHDQLITLIEGLVKTLNAPANP